MLSTLSEKRRTRRHRRATLKRRQRTATLARRGSRAPRCGDGARRSDASGAVPLPVLLTHLAASCRMRSRPSPILPSGDTVSVHEAVVSWCARMSCVMCRVSICAVAVAHAAVAFLSDATARAHAAVAGCGRSCPRPMAAVASHTFGGSRDGGRAMRLLLTILERRVNSLHCCGSLRTSNVGPRTTNDSVAVRSHNIAADGVAGGDGGPVHAVD